MPDKNPERGERRSDQRTGRRPEPQADARPNLARNKDDRGSDSNRSGSESNAGG